MSIYLYIYIALIFLEKSHFLEKSILLLCLLNSVPFVEQRSVKVEVLKPFQMTLLNEAK